MEPVPSYSNMSRAPEMANPSILDPRYEYPNMRYDLLNDPLYKRGGNYDSMDMRGQNMNDPA